jgi:MFS family permease
MYQNAMLLGLCQFLFMASVSVGLSFTGIVGEKMASSTALSTLPFLTMTATTAILTLFLPKIFARLGYQKSFVIGTLLGSIGGGLAAAGVYWHSFFLFCLSGVLTGCYQASALYYRFAAADSVSNEFKSKAIAWVLNGGILAALIGPLLGKYSLHLFPQDYLGSYLLVACLALAVLPFIGLTKLPPRAIAQSQNAVSVWQLIRYPRAIAVILLSAGGYAMMMMVMLASPLAMNHCGYHAADAASVIQWHLLGMFAPSLITGSLINRFSSLSVGLVGCLILIGGCTLALSGIALTHFHWGLMLVGVGWNFMYMAGTTLIMQWSDLSLRGRLQSVNEFITFGTMTITAGGTGWLYQVLGWQSLLIFAMVVTCSLLLIVFWQKRHQDTF